MMIRDYNPDTDYAGLRACVVELQDYEYRIDPRYPDGESIVDDYIPDVLERCEKYQGKVLIAELDGEVAGYAMVWSKVPGEDIEDGDFECGRLADLCVLECHRGKGIGQRLIDASEAWALEQGVRYFRLGVMGGNSYAQALYEARGYRACHVEFEKTLGNVREMTPADMDAVFHVRTSVIDNHMDEDELREMGITRDTVSASLEAGESAGWCAVSGNVVVGFSIAIVPKHEINALFVLPEFSGHGFGEALLNAAVGKLRSQGSGRIALRTDPEKPAYAFYLKRGWKDTGRRNSDDDDDVFLELES